MSDADANRITQTTLSAYSKVLERAYLEANVLLEKSKAKGKLFMGSSGLDARWKVKTAKNGNFQTFSMNDKVAWSSTDNIVEAVLDYGRYRSNDFLFEFEELQNRGNESQIINLKAQKIQDLADDFMLDLAAKFWTGVSSTANEMDGLEAALPIVTTGTYAGIAKSNSYWQNNILDGDAGVNSTFATDAVERIETAKLNASHGGAGGEPDWAICAKPVFAIIAQRHTQGERYQAVSERRIGGRALIVHDMEFYHDTNCTAAVTYLMNSKYIEVHSMYDSMFKITQDEGKSPSGTAYHIAAYPLLKITQPRYFATIKNCT